MRVVMAIVILAAFVGVLRLQRDLAKVCRASETLCAGIVDLRGEGDEAPPPSELCGEIVIVCRAYGVVK